MTDLTPTRATGEELMTAFAPRMGRRYANGRNTDHGPNAHKAVSILSPYIRRRLVLEADVVQWHYLLMGLKIRTSLCKSCSGVAISRAGWNADRRSGTVISTGWTLILPRLTVTAAYDAMSIVQWLGKRV